MHDSEYAATSLHHMGCLTGDGNITNVASFNCRGRLPVRNRKALSMMQLWGHLHDLKEARSYTADGAALDRGRMVHCFHESEI